MVLDANLSIPEYFSGKNIFITGATGFLGKALIEKLLRNCPKIGNIYILLRSKRGKSLSERIAIFANDLVFERVKKEQPDLQIEQKIIPLQGDCTELNLGLSEENRNILVENVNIIFHIAASVRFDDFLYKAIILNIRGTREVCKLALDSKNIIAFIHISTAYANCDRPEVEEKLYPAPMDWKKLIEIAEKYDNHNLEILSDKILFTMPNTYTFSKKIAEHVVNDLLGGKIPCIIFRPSIVISSMRDEPEVGWMDNFNGPVGILAAVGTGILRSVITDPTYRPDYIPIDVVIKSLLVSIWDYTRNLGPDRPLKVFHCTAHKEPWLRFNCDDLFEGFIVNARQNPFKNAVWYPYSYNTSNWYLWYVLTLVTMILPSIFVDAALKLTGKTPRLLKIHKKIFCAQTALHYFMNNNFEFHNEQLLVLRKQILDQDKAAFDYEFQNSDSFRNWYFSKCFEGCKRFVLRLECPREEEIRRAYVLWSMHKLAWAVFFIILYFIFKNKLF